MGKGRRTEGRGQRTEDRGRRSEGRSQKSEAGDQESEVRGPGVREIESPDRLYQTAQGFMEGGREKEAIGALRVFLGLYPDYALAHNDLGVLYFKEGEKEKAQRHYERASQLEPDNLAFQKNLADF